MHSLSKQAKRTFGSRPGRFGIVSLSIMSNTDYNISFQRFVRKMAASILKDKSQENNTGHINMAALDSADILRDTSFASCDFPANSTHNKRSYDANVFDILKVPPEDFAVSLDD